MEGNSAVFFVDNLEAERSLRGSNKRITTPNGTKMIVIVSQSPPPVLDLNSEAVDNMKLCMNKRFNVEFNSLNLSNFHNDAGKLISLVENPGLNILIFSPIFY